MFRRPVILLLLFLALLWLVCAPANAQIEPVIRVYLKRLELADSVHIRFDGDYMLEDGTATFASGTQVDAVLRENRIVIHADGVSFALGGEVKLMRCAGETPGNSLSLNGSNPYEGDLRLGIVDGALMPVLYIDIEDYLLGVVPYEMGDSFPLEALKAQAIAARTYALRKSGSEGAYDVEDTTNDQAFYGRDQDSPLSEQAVRDTVGLCGAYRGELAQCYYSASNGGQTELGQHVWPLDDPLAYGYMDMRDDPYDYENEASPVRRYTIPKRPGETGVGTALHSAIVAALSEQLIALGYAPEDDLVRIDEVLGVQAQTPRFDDGSRLMTQIRFQLKLSVRHATFRDVAVETTPWSSEGDLSLISPLPTPTPTPRPTATPAYSPYVELAQTFDLTLPYFEAGGCEQAMGLSISTMPNELVSVFDIGSSFMIESRRYGHGVGMSQRGAEQMARAYGMNCWQILSFYYPGMQIVSFSAQRQPLPTVDMALMATPAPTPSPTPRPTLMPVTETDLPQGAYVATVSNIEDNSSLNLREYGSLSAGILMRLYKNQRLIVLSSSADGWSHVRTDVVEGYVRTEFLQTAE